MSDEKQPQKDETKQDESSDDLELPEETAEQVKGGGGGGMKRPQKSPQKL